MRDFSDTFSMPVQQPAATPFDSERQLRRAMSKAIQMPPAISISSMIYDWAMHLGFAPDKQVHLADLAQQNWGLLSQFVVSGCPSASENLPVQPENGDRRFAHAAWAKGPFAAISQAFLLGEAFIEAATSNVPGLSAERDRAMTFLARQWMDAWSPSNFPVTNPEVWERTLKTGGSNCLQGAAAFTRDLQALLGAPSSDPDETHVGKTVALTKGKVVLRTHLMELIQYDPATETVHPEPVLIVPAWIMKYYILDLSPANSFVKYLTEQGFTVFMISWRNPDAADAALGMKDYLEQGPLAAIDHITSKGTDRVHTAGYCLGGTLLSIAAAALGRDGDSRIASMTLLAAQTDFTEAGELMLFIDESQVSFLEDIMANQGYLDSAQMMSAFAMMRPIDMIWSRKVRSYLLGEDDPPPNDLMAWNADGTRMPAQMHSEYLRKMFLNNDLASNRYEVDRRAVSLRDIRVPIFGVGTESDHIAPWKSVFKIHNLTHADVTFALTNGGHNAGVISEPGHKHRHFRLMTKNDSDSALTPEDWLEMADWHEGSWWTAWSAWLADRSGRRARPPKRGRALCDAPGTYVFME